MASVYRLDGLPSDLLTEQKEFNRSLKVDSGISAISKEITYTLDGKVDTITEVNSKTGETVMKQMVYSNGRLIGVTATIQ